MREVYLEEEGYRKGGGEDRERGGGINGGKD